MKLDIATATPTSAVILERHCPSMRSMATGNRFGDLLPTSANPKEIPECGYFLIVLKHEGNMPFENDGLRGGMTVCGEDDGANFMTAEGKKK